VLSLPPLPLLVKPSPVVAMPVSPPTELSLTTPQLLVLSLPPLPLPVKLSPVIAMPVSPPHRHIMNATKSSQPGNAIKNGDLRSWYSKATPEEEGTMRK